MSDCPTLFELPNPSDLANERTPHKARPRLKTAERTQVEFKIASLNDLIPQDHIVRLVYSYVDQLNMSNILGTIQSVEGGVGRPATDPKILLTLWLYATLEGIMSARTIADYCEEHIAYQWICGNVKINHHTLSDFSTKYEQQFDEFLTQSVAILMKQGSIDLEEISQDGMRVRANAGSSSFKREGKLLIYHEKAKQYLECLRKELKENPSSHRSKKEAAAVRAAEEREKKAKQAIEELTKLNDEKKKNGAGPKKLKELSEKARASTTDSEARKMKMPCGGFRPAYNVQFATTKNGRVIVGVDVNNRGADSGLIISMIERVCKKFGKLPSRWLVDTGYANYAEFTEADEFYKGCDIYMAPKISGRVERDPYQVLPEDSPGIISWRNRMKTAEAKEIYKGRASTAEFSNAQSRNKGLQQFLVRGLKKVKVVAYRFALTHNMQRFFNMRMRAV
jgi:transposase